ncbi:hypothetical protein [Streptomyces sp. NPDC051993]|uniref:hypothetical protein n=1 Tax=Streptomyces sp. NPDC051993 TaxID=3155286 RepID=UPI00342B659F
MRVGSGSQDGWPVISMFVSATARVQARARPRGISGVPAGTAWHFGPLVWDPTVKFVESLATANNNAVSLEEFKGDRVSEIRATYELLTQTFLKEIPLP